MPSSSTIPAVLADTNILSELTRPRPNAGVVAWLGRQGRVAVSAVTLEELAFGFGLKSQPLVERRTDEIIMNFADVIPISADIARRAGLLRAEAYRAGRMRSQADMLIAATALMNGLTLVTRNVRDFEGCGAKLHNPFT